MFRWYRETASVERRTFWACLGGWALDALDVQMFSLVIPALIATFQLSRVDAGLIGGVTLVFSALGGWLGGALADRIGRVRALQVTILWFAASTFIAAFAQSFEQLLVTKALQGLGFGGEWAAGAVLMAETIRAEHRGKALGAVQSGWAIGWGTAVLLYTAVFSFLPQEVAWRTLFALGLLPALLIIYIRRAVPEPVRVSPNEARLGFGQALVGIFAPQTLRATLVGGLFGLGAHGGFYALFTWLPTFLKTERGLSVMGTGGYLAVIIVAFGCGCLVAGQLLDRLGRKRTVALFAAGCIALTIAYLVLPIGGAAMLVLGFPLGFCAAGIPASMGALFNELYPAGVRGTGVGFCYNAGRIAAAGLPPLIGALSEVSSLGTAIGINAALAYSLVLLALLLLPETRGKALDDAAANDPVLVTETL
ncbi:major facilitator superfamily MFS_1 [Methylobacterium sp. 4-46]|uniref:MFS transporter n=1 Tax=unclassified Methylobacterium TaxID=2615210 RepID=UPI000152C90C|nr:MULTISPECIES: MFS transporter [Methylobacterium]ACA15328.1 major facilitator superfamily MFS_1 [Methylobacterium sp. 4-46]WFT81054.1 MFS transporter [Methylobacterium nodulans]